MLLEKEHGHHHNIGLPDLGNAIAQQLIIVGPLGGGKHGEAQAGQLPHESCAGACGCRRQMGIHRDDHHTNGAGQGSFAR